MISLRESSDTELPVFHEMENQEHARDFILSTSLNTHRENFANPQIVYLSIDNAKGKLAGYFILAIEDDRSSIEFRRIVIDHAHKGIGQQAIRLMEHYCQTQLGAKRIWLDVFEDNKIGRHIYSKLGYAHFRTGTYDGRTLLYYEKQLEKS